MSNTLEINSSTKFSEVMDYIDANYNFTPSKFKNGTIVNEENQNNGSCKVFAFAKIKGYTKEQTLLCFGEHYQDVLKTPEQDSHQNIRNFMEYGWEGIEISDNVLKELTNN